MADLTDEAVEYIRVRLLGQTSPQAVETLAAIEELQRRRKESATSVPTVRLSKHGAGHLDTRVSIPLAEEILENQAEVPGDRSEIIQKLEQENRDKRVVIDGLTSEVAELRRRLSERERDTVTERANRDAVAARVTMAAAEAELRKIAAAQIEASQPVDLICSACRGQHTGTKDQIGTTCGRVPPPGATWLGLCRGELYRADGRENGPRPAVEPLEPACPRCGQLLTIPVDARHPTLDTFSIQCFCGQLVEAFFWSQQGELDKDVPLR